MTPFRLSDPHQFLALGFGAGLAPRMPGTVGTLVGIPFVLALQALPLWLEGLAVVVAFFVGVRVCQVTARAVGVHDHPAIVWDEVVGLMVTFIGVSAGLPALIAGFVLFRLFDILKPWPIRWVDRYVHGGFGIMLDDVLAGIAAAVVLHVLLYLGVLG